MANCELSLSEAPRLVGIGLGMNPTEVNSVLGRSAKVKIGKKRHYTLFKNFRNSGKASGVLTGARAFYVRFFDQRVYQVEIFYHRGVKPSNLEALVKDFAALSGFPPEYFNIEHGYAEAGCRGFNVSADTILNPHIQITDTALKELVDKSRK